MTLLPPFKQKEKFIENSDPVKERTNQAICSCLSKCRSGVVLRRSEVALLNSQSLNSDRLEMRLLESTI